MTFKAFHLRALIIFPFSVSRILVKSVLKKKKVIGLLVNLDTLTKFESERSQLLIKIYEVKDFYLFKVMTSVLPRNQTQ